MSAHSPIGPRSTPPTSASVAGMSAPLMLSVSGCRGIFGKTMTPEVAARFAMVVGGWFVERAGQGMPPP
ncbi:MAG TPA: hypothetical protein PKE29_17355, partial [Phycisphaerales bacterium]|nr:hypothetical protein [Phycisphaerales bacterium]